MILIIYIVILMILYYDIKADIMILYYGIMILWPLVRGRGR